jgi:hypothetical protein
MRVAEVFVKTNPFTAYPRLKRVSAATCAQRLRALLARAESRTSRMRWIAMRAAGHAPLLKLLSRRADSLPWLSPAGERNMRYVTIARVLLVLTVPLFATACSSTKTICVAVPPRMDLKPYPTIGLVAFTSSSGDHDLERLATQKFLHAVQSAQPGTRVVELGNESDVLDSVHKRSWDPATLRAVKEAHGVDVVVLGRLEMEKVRPEVKLSTVWKSVSAKQDVNVTLSARLMETASAATMWTNAAEAKTTVASANLSGGHGHGGGSFGARDPESVYGEMIDGLAYQITDDFRVHYVNKRVPKDAPEVASTND